MEQDGKGTDKFVILFDGSCNLCNNIVRFITKNDSGKKFCFIPLGSQKAEKYLEFYENGKISRGSMLLIMGDHHYSKSDAVLRILKYLDGFWPVLWIFIIVPGFIRNPVYDIIAKYRYKWFGACVDCPEPGSC